MTAQPSQPPIDPAPSQRRTILWPQVWGLTALLAAHSFAWMAYNLYQPQLLQSLGFANLALWLGIFQGFLAALIEPVVGYLSDRSLRRLGSRLPLITTGVTLAGLIFVAVALLAQVQLLELAAVRWLIPLLMTVWVMAMIIFRGPVVALLQNTAPLRALPQANTALVVVFGLVGALEPLLNQAFQRLGTSVTFMLGAMTLVVGAAAVYFNCPPPVLFEPSNQPRQSVALVRLGGLLVVGFGAGSMANLLLRALPTEIGQHQTGLSANLATGGILLVSALLAIPLERWSRRHSHHHNDRALTAGLGLAVLVLLAPVLAATRTNLLGLLDVALILLAGIAWGQIFTAQIPLALQTLSPDRAGLATGTLFGGIGAATAVGSILLHSPVVPGVVWGWGVGALLICVAGILLIQMDSTSHDAADASAMRDQ